jgi:hypothetical protein
MRVISGVALTSKLAIAGIPSPTVTAESEMGTSSEVLVVRTADSDVFRDSAKTMDVEVGNRMPKEMSREFQRSFMRRFWELLSIERFSNLVVSRAGYYPCIEVNVDKLLEIPSS